MAVPSGQQAGAVIRKAGEQPAGEHPMKQRQRRRLSRLAVPLQKTDDGRWLPELYAEEIQIPAERALRRDPKPSRRRRGQGDLQRRLPGKRLCLPVGCLRLQADIAEPDDLAPPAIGAIRLQPDDPRALDSEFWRRQRAEAKRDFCQA